MPGRIIGILGFIDKCSEYIGLIAGGALAVLLSTGAAIADPQNRLLLYTLIGVMACGFAVIVGQQIAHVLSDRGLIRSQKELADAVKELTLAQRGTSGSIEREVLKLVNATAVHVERSMGADLDLRDRLDSTIQHLVKNQELLIETLHKGPKP